MKKKCELLIPAGGVNQFIAAVENGADAVYLGGKLFNARINAGNFENEDLKKVVDFAHLRGVKVYVTMNTLILDEEMSKALQYAGFLYKIGVDALIIQDIGFAYEVRKIFPDFPMHLSTQGSVYNLEGVLAAKKMGFERVVLARELSFDEIDEIAKNDDTELEVFVHGALCLCYSGQCQMSRYFGGRSGNRGQCAQPCRLPYKVLDEDFRLVDSFKYPLSPKDLCLIDQIGDLAKIGVASLKVEGRMKSAEYVAVVTRIYRKYLDEYYEKGWYQVSDEDRHQLMQIFNRGGFTQGYYWGDPEQQLISGDIPKHRGVKLGKVIKQVQGTSLIDVKLYRKLSIGDGVEIQGREVFGNIVTYIKPLKGGLTRIGDLKGRTVHGDILYQISSKEQLKEAKETYSNVTLSEGKYMRKTPVNMEFHGQFGKHLTLKITCCIEKRNFAVVIEDEPDLIQKAFNKATSEEDIRKQLGKMGNTPFMLGKVGICVDNDIMIPISSINDMRRRGISELENEIKKAYHREDKKILIENTNYETLSGNGEFYFYNTDTMVEMDKEDRLNGAVAVLPIIDFISDNDKITQKAIELGMKEVIPYIGNISKGKEDQFIRENFELIVETIRKSSGKIYIGNICWIEKFAKAGITVLGDFGLNIFNGFAIKGYMELGMHKGYGSLECIEDREQQFPLMISQHITKGEWLIDRRGQKIAIKKNAAKDKMILVAQNRIKNDKEPGTEGRVYMI